MSSTVSPQRKRTFLRLIVTLDSMYWGDGNVLDVNGGDYQVIENLRVVQKCMRRVYPLAVARIGDRRLNQTPASIAQAQTAFMSGSEAGTKYKAFLSGVGSAQKELGLKFTDKSGNMGALEFDHKAGHYHSPSSLTLLNSQAVSFSGVSTT